MLFVFSNSIQWTEETENLLKDNQKSVNGLDIKEMYVNINMILFQINTQNWNINVQVVWTVFLLYSVET